MVKKIISLNIAIATISDSRTSKTDISGEVLEEKIIESPHKLYTKSIIKDDIKKISSYLKECVKNKNIDVIITTGGTGLTGRDSTPEAVRQIIEKEIDGFGELFRMLSYQKIGTSALQSRAIAGIAKGKFIFAIPGSPSACKDACLLSDRGRGRSWGVRCCGGLSCGTVGGHFDRGWECAQHRPAIASKRAVLGASFHQAGGTQRA